MENFTKMQLYVVQPNETIKSISNKFKLDEGELIRLNPILKYSHIHRGQPLNIPIIESRDIPPKITACVDNQCLLTYMYHVFAIKESILAKMFTPDYLPAIMDSLKKSVDSIIECIDKHIPLANRYNIRAIVVELEDELLTFVDLVTTNDKSGIIKFNNHINDLMDNIEELGKDVVEISNVNLLEIFKKWQLFILKMIAKKHEEAEIIFIDIVDKYITFAKKVLLK